MIEHPHYNDSWILIISVVMSRWLRSVERCSSSLCARVTNLRRVLSTTVPRAAAAASAPTATVLAQNLEKELQIFSHKRETHITLQSLMETGRGERLERFVESGESAQKKINISEKVLFQVACFLHREMPIRLARQVFKLENNPHVSTSRKLFIFRCDKYCGCYINS